MGNYASCALAGAAAKHGKAPQVLFPSGEIRHLDAATTAAELMLETPNSFLVNSKSLKLGRRFTPLTADEGLERGGVYVLFPMERLNSLVTAADMGALFLAAKRGGAGRVRVVPEVSGEGAEEEDAGRRRVEVGVPEIGYRRSVCWAKKPVLETILEEPVC